MSKDSSKDTKAEAMTADEPTSGNVAPTLDYSESAALIDEQAAADADAADASQAMTEEETKAKRDEYEATLNPGKAAEDEEKPVAETR